jgi:spermidine synthase
MFQAVLQNKALLLTVLWALSGFSVLTLETVWMREIALRAGNTAVASTLVIAVFFVAAALGNLVGAQLVAGKKRALLLYGRFEVASALAALAMFAMNRWLWAHGSVLPEGWGGHVAAAALLVGLPSFFSGASFPGLAETFVEDAQHRTATGGRFYGMNLLGAALGVAAGGVWLPLQFGVSGAFAVAAGVQFAAGMLAWRIASAADSQPRPLRREAAATLLPSWLGWGVLAASGVLSLAAQTLLIVWARQVLEGSVYAVCGVLATFLSGLGAGGLSAAALRRRGFPAAGLMTAFAGTGALLLFAVPALGTWLCGCEVLLTAATPAGLLAQALLGCGLVVLPLTFCLGGVFPVAWELVSAGSPSQGRVLGTALAVNKLGAAAGAALGLFILMPWLGLAHGTLLLAWGYAGVACVPLMQAGRRTAWRVACLAGVAAVGLTQTLRKEPVLGLAAGERAVASCAGAYGPVAVVENRESGSRQILLNSRQRLSGTRRALASQRHQSWVPLLLCRRPERVVTIGMAAGISAAAALDFPLKELHSVELVPEVAAAARAHFREWSSALFTDPRSQVHAGDGRVVLARLPGTFDAIICDLFFPGEDGTANLYSREFFQASRARLSPGGLFCLWLPCYQQTPQTAGIVIRTFTEVFPNAIAVRANLDPLQPVIGLIGAEAQIPLSDAFLDARLKSVAVPSPFFRSAETVRLLFVADLHSAEPDFSAFPLTTDDRPLFAYLGPRQPRGKERLFGFPLLDWIGRRALRPTYPSVALGTTPPARLLACLRAGNFTYAAAAAELAVPCDTRPEAARTRQVRDYLQRAAELCPEAAILSEARGRD